MKTIKINNINVSNAKQFTLIAGLNVLEDRKIIDEVATECKNVTQELDIPFIFKASYDKANRSSVNSFRACLSPFLTLMAKSTSLSGDKGSYLLISCRYLLKDLFASFPIS